MSYLIIMIAALALWCGFALLTRVEARRGRRLFEGKRRALDRLAGKFAFAYAHVNFASALSAYARRAGARLMHDGAHAALQAVRTMERLLTRLVRKLRPARERASAPKEASRAYVRDLSAFKGHLEATRPPMPEL